MRTIFIAFDLPLIGLVGRDNADDVMSWCEDDHVQTPFDVAGQPKALFAVIAPIIDLDGSVRIGEGFCCIRKVKASPVKARFALDLISFEIHGVSVGLRTTFGKSGELNKRLPPCEHRRRVNHSTGQLRS
jgi:hypothetical protein